MRQHLLLICFFAFFQIILSAQSGCPGCIVNVPAGLPADTLYLPALPNGTNGTPYNEDIPFRVPKTTTPVHVVDTTTPPGLPISKIEIVGLEGLPPGLFWEANQSVFETATQTDGCIKICGTPTKSDSFVLTVKLKATVFIFTQEASFLMRLYIAPKVSVTDGFTMTNYTGCGSAKVSFTNKIPSGGNAGVTYKWDFGDGATSTAENPPPHTYTKPGTYAVNYHATIDTVGYRLVSATVLSLGCTDLFSSGPDIYLFLVGPGGQQIFNSSPDIPNVTLPYTFPIGLPLDPQNNYNLEVWDEDSGLEGSDDPCGAIPFNILSGDTLTSGAFRVVLNIVHPVDEVLSTDTVTVYAQPTKPNLTANTFSACAGSDNIVLESSYGAGNQWWLNGLPISGATDFLYMPKIGGYYQVQLNTLNGCSVISDSALVTFHPLPAIPTYKNDRNRLKLIDTLAVPANYALQWYLFAAALPGATGFTHCALINGEYSLVVTDKTTGCTNVFSSTVVIDPNYNCLLDAREVSATGLNIFPNPTSGEVTVQLAGPVPAAGNLRVWDVAGRLVQNMPVAPGADRVLLDGSELHPGSYFLEFFAGEQRLVGQLVIIR